MSKASELEAARLAAERNDARCAAIQDAYIALDPSVTLTAIATQLLAEATYVAEQRKSGWKSRSDAHTAAGRILEQWAKDLAAYLERDKPPMRPPLDKIASPARHADLDPADGPISAQITSGLLSQTGVTDPVVMTNWPDGAITPDAATRVRLAVEAGRGVDDKLDAAFGPVDRPAPVHITAAPANYAWCDATSGLRGYIGTATCPDCIARYDAYDEAADKALALRPTEPIEPRVVLLTGSRDWTDAGLIRETLTRLNDTIPGLVIRHGDCPTGADAIAAQWCAANAVAQDPVPADWAAHGKAAGPIRNQAMLDREPCPEAYVAFHKGASRGTQDMVVRCEKAGIRGNVYRESETTPAVGTLPGLGAVAWLGDGESVAFDGAHTDGPAIRVDWNSKGEATVGIPQFSEPGAPPPRQTQQRMTFEQVRGHGMARARGADHRSYSQVQAFSECGIRYALSDLDVTPAWWNVGGTALHYACETINHEAYQVQQTFGDGPKYIWTDHAIETLWTNCLNRSVSETIVEHPTVGPDTWRAAKKGAEGYDWWRTNGVDMVRRWITRLTWLYEQGWAIATVDGKPAIELDCPMFIMLEPNAPGDRTGPAIKVENIIDLAMVRGDTFLIIDAKSGASAPDSTAQLGQYGHALNRALSAVGQAFAANARILGAYWLARTDMLAPVDVTKSDTATDIRELHPWAEIEYLITTMHAAESQGLYLPNKSKSDRFGCGSCGVAGLCPVGPR